VWFDAAPVECYGSTPALEDLDGGFGWEPEFVHVIDAAADLDCRLHVQVENRGRAAATLRGAVLPFHGPGTGAAVRARELSPFALPPIGEDEFGTPAIDAVYSLDYRLESGSRLVLTIGLEHQPDGCMSPDSMMWVRDVPIIEVSVLGLRGTRAPTGIPYVQRGTADSSCDVP
jgi:hypothetical protein